jgi:hypothetical protein
MRTALILLAVVFEIGIGGGVLFLIKRRERQGRNIRRVSVWGISWCVGLIALGLLVALYNLL